MGVMRDFHLAVAHFDCRKMLYLLNNDERRSETVNSRDRRWRTAAMLIARRLPNECEVDDRRLMLDMLGSAGAQLDLVDNAGNTALMHAVQSGSEDVVDWLLTAGADARRWNDVGVTPLWQSVFDVVSRRKRDRWRIVQRLLMSDCAIDQKCRGPLLFASGTEYVYCFEEPVSALDVAIDGGCHSTAHLLVSAGCSCSASVMMTISADHGSSMSWLDDLLVESRSLQHLCRLLIRRSAGLRLHSVVESLCLPSQIRSFLLLDNITEPSQCAS